MPNIDYKVTGQQNIESLNRSLRDLHSTMYAINTVGNMANNSLTNSLGTVSSPTQGIAQATAEYRQLSQELDQQRRLFGDLKTSYNDYVSSIISSAQQAGRATQEYAQMRQELINLGNAADAANRQISTFSFASGMNYGQATQFFGSLSQQGGAFSPAQNQVGFSPQNQTQFMAALSDAVQKATANGMHTSVTELLEGVTGLQMQMANRGITANAGGNLGIMTAFTQSGGLGIFGQRGAQVISDINQSLAPGGNMNPLMQQYLAQQHPGESYYQIQYQAEEGIRSPQDLQNLLNMERQRYGNAANDQYFMASALARDFGLPSAHVGMDVLNAQKYLSSLNPNDPQYQQIAQYMQGGSLEYMNVALQAAQGQFTQNGKFNAVQAAAAFKQASGRDLGGKLPVNATLDQFLSQLAKEGAPEGSTNAARSLEQSQATIANNYTEIAHNMRDSITALANFNEAVSGTARYLTTNFGQQPGGLAAVPIVGGTIAQALGAAGSIGYSIYGARMLGRLGRGIFRRGGPAAAQAAEAGGASAAEGGATTVAEAAIPAAATTTASTVAGGGIAGLLGAVALPATIAAGVGFGSSALYDRISGTTGRNPLALPALAAMNPFAALGMGGMNWLANSGPLAGTGLGNFINSRMAANENLPVVGGILRTIYGSHAQATSTQPGVSPQNPSVSAQSGVDILQKMNDTLTAISSALGTISATASGELKAQNDTNETLGKILAAVSNQTQASTDRNYQARYGVTRSVGSPNSMLSYVPSSTGGGSTGVVTGNPSASSPTINGGGGSGGFDSIVGGSSYTIGQGFGVVSPDVDQSIYNYGSSYGLAKGHTGIDVDVPRGTKVFTPVGGVVMVAGGAEPGGGSYFVDDPSGAGTPATGELRIGVPDANGDLLILGHLSKIVVNVGDKVKPGQLVAYSGTANGDHVHVEYRKKTPGQNSGYTLVDPQQQLNSMVPPSQGGGTGANAGPVSNGQAGGGTARWRPLIERAAKQIGINPDVVQAIMMNEDESGDPTAVSAAGAIGLMQVMPFNFLPGEDKSDPYTQILAGARYLKGQYDRYGNWNSAAAGYLGAVDENGNPTTVEDAYGTSGIKYAQMFQQHLAQLRSQGATVQEKALTGIAGAASYNILGATDSPSGNAGNTVEFAPLTVNVVYPDGKVVTSKLPVTSKNPYNGIRQYTTRAAGRG